LASGVKANALTPWASYPSRVAVSLPVVRFHNLISPMHLPPEARDLPSALNTTCGEANCEKSSRNVVAMSVLTFQILMVLPPNPQASISPSGLNDIDSAQYFPIFRPAFSLPDATSQNRIVACS